MLQSFRHYARERSGASSRYTIAFAVHDDDVSEVASFQTEFNFDPCTKGETISGRFIRVAFVACLH